VGGHGLWSKPLSNGKKDRLDRIEELLEKTAELGRMTALQTAENAKHIAKMAKEHSREMKLMRTEHNREMKEIRSLLTFAMRRYSA